MLLIFIQHTPFGNKLLQDWIAKALRFLNISNATNKYLKTLAYFS